MSSIGKVFKGGVLIVGAVVALIVVIGAGRLVETNKFKTFQVKQAYISGTMSIRKQPGMYMQNLGEIVTYDKGGMIYFSVEKEDGGEGALTGPMESSFLGNATGDVSGIMKFRMPLNDEKIYAIHELYGSQDAVTIDLVRQAVAGAIKQAGPLFKPEEAWITKRSEYQDLIKEMLEIGKYATKTYEHKVERGGKMITEQVTELIVDSLGKNVILEESPLVRFGITIEQFEIKGIEFDEKTSKLIRAKKEAEQQQITLRAQSEKAKVEATKAVEEGKKRVAEAEATALVAKKTATVEAEKKYEVAKYASDAKKVKAEADLYEAEKIARANALKVRAGLTPQEKASWKYKTDVDVAKAMWGPGIGAMTLPTVMTSGGGGNGAGAGALEAIGINQMLEIADKVSKK